MNTFTAKLLNIVTPHKINGVNKVKLYTNINTNLKVGDYIFIVNGNYDNSNSNPYLILAVDICSIVIDLDYVSNKPLYNKDNINEYTKVYLVDNIDKFNYENADNNIGNKSNVGFKYSKNNNYIFLSKIKNLPNTDSPLSYNRFFKSSDSTDLEISNFPKETSGVLINSTSLSFTASTSTGVGLTYGISGNNIDDIYIDYDVNSAYLYGANRATVSSTFSNLWAYDIKTDNLFISKPIEKRVNSIYNTISTNVNTFTTALTFSNGYPIGHFGLYSSLENVVSGSYSSYVDIKQVNEVGGSPTYQMISFDFIGEDTVFYENKSIIYSYGHERKIATGLSFSFVNTNISATLVSTLPIKIYGINFKSSYNNYNSFGINNLKNDIEAPELLLSTSVNLNIPASSNQIISVSVSNTKRYNMYDIYLGDYNGYTVGFDFFFPSVNGINLITDNITGTYAVTEKINAVYTYKNRQINTPDYNKFILLGTDKGLSFVNKNQFINSTQSDITSAFSIDKNTYFLNPKIYNGSAYSFNANRPIIIKGDMMLENTSVYKIVDNISLYNNSYTEDVYQIALGTNKGVYILANDVVFKPYINGTREDREFRGFAIDYSFLASNLNLVVNGTASVNSINTDFDIVYDIKYLDRVTLPIRYSSFGYTLSSYYTNSISYFNAYISINKFSKYIVSTKGGVYYLYLNAVPENTPFLTKKDKVYIELVESYKPNNASNYITQANNDRNIWGDISILNYEGNIYNLVGINGATSSIGKNLVALFNDTLEPNFNNSIDLPFVVSSTTSQVSVKNIVYSDYYKSQFIGVDKVGLIVKDDIYNEYQTINTSTSVINGYTLPSNNINKVLYQPTYVNDLNLNNDKIYVATDNGIWVYYYRLPLINNYYYRIDFDNGELPINPFIEKNNRIYISNEFEYNGKLFEKDKIYKYDSINREWVLDITYQESYITKSNFKSGSFVRGIWNDGLLGSNEKTEVWSGNNVTFKNGYIYNIVWKNGNITDKKITNSKYYYAQLDTLTNNVNIINDTTYNNGFGFSYFINSTIENGTFNSINIENSIVGIDVATHTPLFTTLTNIPTYTNSINLIKSKISNSVLNYIGLSNSVISNSIINYSRLSNNVKSNTTLNNSIMLSGDIDNTGYIKILRYEKWQNIYNRKDINDGVGVITIHKFFISEEDLNKIDHNDNIIINKLKTNSSSILNILNDNHKMSYSSSDGYSFENFEDIEKVIGSQFIRYKKLVSKRSPNQNRVKTILSKDINNKLFIREVPNVNSLASIDIAILDLNYKSDFYTSNTDINLFNDDGYLYISVTDVNTATIQNRCIKNSIIYGGNLLGGSIYNDRNNRILYTPSVDSLSMSLSTNNSIDIVLDKQTSISNDKFSNGNNIIYLDSINMITATTSYKLDGYYKVNSYSNNTIGVYAKFILEFEFMEGNVPTNGFVVNTVNGSYNIIIENVFNNYSFADEYADLVLLPYLNTLNIANLYDIVSISTISNVIIEFTAKQYGSEYTATNITTIGSFNSVIDNIAGSKDELSPAIINVSELNYIIGSNSYTPLRFVHDFTDKSYIHKTVIDSKYPTTIKSGIYSKLSMIGRNNILIDNTKININVSDINNSNYNELLFSELNVNNIKINRGVIHNSYIIGATYNNGLLHKTYVKNSVVNTTAIKSLFEDVVYTGNIYDSNVNFKTIARFNLSKNTNLRNTAWVNGVFNNGLINNIDWYNGNFINGNLLNSKFLGGTFTNGFFGDVNTNINRNIFYRGTWLNGNFNNGLFGYHLSYTSPINILDLHTYSSINYYHTVSSVNNASWYNGIFNKGVFTGMYNGSATYTNVWYDGIFNNGEVSNSVRWFNGTFNNGVFRSTYGDGYNSYSWENGTFNNGVFGDKLNTPTSWYNGVFNGGSFIGKIWNNGTFLKGTFEGSGIATYSNVNDNIYVHGALYPSKFIEPFNTSTSYYGLWRNGTVTSDKFNQLTSSLIKAFNIDYLRKIINRSLNRDTVIFNNVLWVNGVFNHSNGKFNNSLWLSGTFSDGSFNYSSFNPYVLRQGNYTSTVEPLRWSADFSDNTIWQNGKLFKSNFWISKWQNGTFEGGGNDYNDGEIDQTNGAMISGNFKKGTANYINAYNVIWENGRFRNGNWYGANLALEFSKNDIKALHYLGETFESGDPKTAKFIEDMLVHNNQRLQLISGTNISINNRLFSWNTFLNSSANQYVPLSYTGNWSTIAPNPIIIDGIVFDPSSSSGGSSTPQVTVGLSASVYINPTTVSSNANISYTFDANTINPYSSNDGDFLADTKNISMESIFTPNNILNENTVYGISMSAVSIPSNTSLIIQYEKNTNQYETIATLTNNNITKIYTFGVYTKINPKIKFIVNSTITNDAGIYYDFIKVNKKIQLSYSVGTVNTEGVYKDSSNNLFSGGLQYSNNTTIKNITYGGNLYQTPYDGVTISVDTDIRTLAVTLNNNIQTIKTMVGNGVFLEGIWENGVWANGARTYAPYNTTNRTIVADNIISTYKTDDTTWNIVIGVPDVNSGNGNSGILDLLNFMSDNGKVVSDKLVSVGNIVATDINGNRKLIKSIMTARLGTVNNQVITDTILNNSLNTNVYKNKLEKFNVNGIDYYILILSYKETFPVNNISKDSENHPIYITKNIWMNGVFLNGVFEGVWMNGYVKGGPKVTVLKDTQWIDGTFDGGRFISSTKNSIGTFSFSRTIGDVSGNNSVFRQNVTYPNDLLNTGLVQNMKFIDNLLLTDTNDIPTSTDVSGARSYTYLSHMDVVYDKYITSSLFDQVIANDRQRNINDNTLFYNVPTGQITTDILESESSFIFDNPTVGNVFNRNRYNVFNVKLGTKYKIYSTPFDADFSRSPNNSINIDIPSGNNILNLASYSLYGWTHGNPNLSNTSTVNNLTVSDSYFNTSNTQNGDLIIGGFNNFLTRRRYSMVEVITKTASDTLDYTSSYINHNRSVLQISNGYNVYSHNETTLVTYSNVVNDMLPYMSKYPDKPIYTYVYNNHGGYRNSIWIYNNNVRFQRYYRIRYYETDMIPFYNYFTYSNTDGVYWWNQNSTRGVYNKAIIPYTAISPFINYDDNKYSLIDNIKFISGGVQRVRTIIRRTNQNVAGIGSGVGITDPVSGGVGFAPSFDAGGFTFTLL